MPRRRRSKETEAHPGSNDGHCYRPMKDVDFLFIPPDVPHQPINLSDTEPAIAIVARNDPNEQEHVELYSKDKQN
jgi:uncharacterized RmlC-like cupin family protein